MNNLIGARMWTFIATLCIGSTACAPLPDPGDPTEVGEAVEELSNQEHCGTAPANALIFHNGNVTSSAK